MALGNAKILTGGEIAAAQSVTASHDVFIPEVWANPILLAFREKLVWGGLCQDVSAFIASGGDKVHFPKVDEIATGDKAPEGSISYGTDAAAQTELALLIDQHKYAATLIEDVLKIQANYDMLNIYATEIGYALAKTVDEYIESQVFASFQAAGGAINTIDLSGALASVDKFDLILTNVLAEDQEISNWRLVLHTSAFADLANFVQLGYGTSESALGAGFGKNGLVKDLFGMPTYVTPNVTVASTDMDTGAGADAQTALGYVVHKSALYWAASQPIRIQSDYSIDHLGTKVVGDTMFGMKINNSSTAGQRRAFILD